MSDEYRTPTPVAGVAFDGPPPGQHKIDVSNLTVGVVHLGAILVALFGIAAVYFHTDAHLTNRVIHLDEASSLKGGGAAYQSDIVGVQKAIEMQQKKTRRVLHGMKINCTRKPGEGFACSVDLPEEDADR